MSFEEGQRCWGGEGSTAWCGWGLWGGLNQQNGDGRWVGDVEGGQRSLGGQVLESEEQEEKRVEVMFWLEQVGLRKQAAESRMDCSLCSWVEWRPKRRASVSDQKQLFCFLSEHHSIGSNSSHCWIVIDDDTVCIYDCWVNTDILFDLLPLLRFHTCSLNVFHWSLDCYTHLSSGHGLSRNSGSVCLPKEELHSCK